jgi:small-conductance mechanosensitive channel
MPTEIVTLDLSPIEQTAREVIVFAPRLGIAILILLAFYIAHKVIQRLFARYSSLTRLPEEVTGLLRRTIGLVMFFFGITTALGTLGVDVTAIVAGLGLTGFALGFALQDIISNFLAGVLLTVQRPFRRGNYIRVGDKEGVVIDMDLRYTMLQRENVRILIPNSVLFKEAIIITLRPPTGSAAEAADAPPLPTA